MRLAGETACATKGKSFACKGGAGAFAWQFLRARFLRIPPSLNFHGKAVG
jgi:hypothetical protein